MNLELSFLIPQKVGGGLSQPELTVEQLKITTIVLNFACIHANVYLYVYYKLSFLVSK